MQAPAGPAPEAGSSDESRTPPPGLDVALAALPAGPTRQLVVGVLARCGARSVAVDDGPGALEVARRSRPRVAVLHAFLRGLTGPEVAAAFRAEPALAHARLLLLGGPPPAGRWEPDPAQVHGTDAWLPDDANAAELEVALRLLLRRDAGDDVLPDDEDVRAWSRLATRDIMLCEAALLAQHRRSGRPDRAELLRPARGACLERFPSPGAARRQALLRAFDEEAEELLGDWQPPERG